MERFYNGRKKKKLYCLSEQALAIIHHLAITLNVSNSTALEMIVRRAEGETMRYYLMKEEMIGVRPTKHNLHCINERFDSCLEKPEDYKKSTKQGQEEDIKKTLEIAEKMWKH